MSRINRLMNILSASTGLSKVMGDVLRILILFAGSLWLWEIYLELKGFRATLSEESPTLGDVVRAVNRLSKEGFVTTEKRIRASLRGEGFEDLLVSLNLNFEERTKLLMDDRVRRYQLARQRAFSEFSNL